MKVEGMNLTSEEHKTQLKQIHEATEDIKHVMGWKQHDKSWLEGGWRGWGGGDGRGEENYLVTHV